MAKGFARWRATALATARALARTILPVAVVVATGLIACGVLIVAYAQLLGEFAYAQLLAFMTTPESASWVIILTSVPVLLIFVLAFLTWAGVVTQVAGGAVSRARVSLLGAVGRSLMRSGPAALVGFLALLAVLVAIVATPVLIIVGLLGLALTPLARTAPRWPSIRSLVLLAIPLGFAAWLTARVALSLPSVWLSGSAIRGAFADAATRSRGREVEIVLALVIAGALSFGITEGAALLAAPLGEGWVLAIRIGALILVGPLVLVALTVQYLAVGKSTEVPPVAASPAARRRARIAVVTVVSMMIPVVFVGVPAPAQAAGANEVSFAIGVAPDSPVPTDSPTTISFYVNDHRSESRQPTGQVRIFIDDVEQPGTFLLPGPFTPLQFDYTFASGEHVVRGEYLGDADYAPSTQTLAVTAGDPAERIATTTAFTMTPASPSPAGAPITAHVVVTAVDGSSPAGSVAILLDGSGDFLAEKRLETTDNGRVDLTFSLPPGMQRVVAYFTADAPHQTSSIDETQIVSPDTSVVALSADAPITVFGQPTTFTATVASNPAPTGTVSFAATPTAGGVAIDLGSASLSGGSASVTVDSLPIGAFHVVASYGGGPGVSGADSAGLVHTVSKAAVTVGITSDLVAPAYGSAPRLTVTVAAQSPGAGTPTGAVVVKRDGETVGSGVLVAGAFSAVIGGSTAGTHHFTAEYAGDSSFDGSSGSLSLGFSQLETTTRLTGSNARSHVYGDSQTYAGTVFTATETTKPTGTVQLWVGGYRVAETTLVNGAYSFTTTLAPVPAQFPTTAWIVYLGDGNHAGSQVLPPDRPRLEMVKANVAPVLTATTQPPSTAIGIGSTVTLTATLPILGAGPGGTVTFSSPTGEIATAPVVDGVATTTFDIAATTTRFTASYSGDSNFAQRDADAITVIANRSAVSVSLSGPATYAYGSLVELVATVEIAEGVTPDHGVEFRTTGTVIASDVPVVAGVATLTACVGFDTACPEGIPQLGSGDTQLTARYIAGPLNNEGVSAPVTMTVTRAQTTLDLDVTSNTIVTGVGTVDLAATVSSTRAGLTPTGSVTFYGSEPGSAGGEALVFLGSATLVNGVATFRAQTGAGATDLRYPADAIVAEYFPAGALFEASRDRVAIDLQRVGVQISVGATTLTAVNAPTQITAQLTHNPGTSANFTGTVEITSSDGQSCLVQPTGASRIVNCDFVWHTVGTRTVSARYLGDAIYGTASSSATEVTVGKGAVSLAAAAPASAFAGQEVVVRWTPSDRAASGTVTVWGDGAPWCEVAIAAGQCAGTFDARSNTGSPVPIVVRYSGDENFNGTQQELDITVANCAALDVRSSNPSLGTVSIDTAPNCGGTGYAPGTLVKVTAHPRVGGELVHWLGYQGGDLEPVGTSLANFFRVTSSSETWVRVATFGVPCSTITADVTGSGGLWIYPLSNCTTASGAPGWSYGTTVRIAPDPATNRDYPEPDVFLAFGAVPGGVQSTNAAGETSIALTVVESVVVPVAYGPLCHLVTVVTDPVVPNLAGTVTTPTNCSSPGTTGYLRGTRVDVAVDVSNTDATIAGWSVDGVALEQPAAAPAATSATTPTSRSKATVVVGAGNPIVTANIEFCYTLAVTIDGAVDTRGNPIGAVKASPQPNCADGSKRYASGTSVTLTPEVLVKDAIFSGWDGDRMNGPAPGGTGIVPIGVRTIVVTKNTTTTAGFYAEALCSRLTVIGDPGAITIDNKGCGPGYYFDYQKQAAIGGTEPQSYYWQGKFRTPLSITPNPDEQLGTYVSVRGDIRNCFGTTGDPSGPSTSTGEYRSYGPLTATSNTCLVGGPIVIKAQTCQSLVTEPLLLANSALHSDWPLPASIFQPDGYGSIGEYTTAGFEWATPFGATIDGDGNAAFDSLGTGACGDAHNTFAGDADLAVIASAPGDAFEFIGWKHADDSVSLANPLVATATTTEPTMTVTPIFSVTCASVTLTEGITIDGPVATCPGTTPDQGLYVVGTAVRVRAVAILDGRWVQKFTSGVNSTPITEDPITKDLIGYVLVGNDETVKAFYPTSAQRIASGIAQVGKVTVGILAVAVPIIVSIAFPPVGILFGVLGAAAGIASLAGSDKAAAAFDLVNPTKIGVCAARWAFGNAGDPTGKANLGNIAGTANKLQEALRGKDILTAKLTNVGALTGSAGFVIGLYNAGITNTDLSTQTVSELRDTETMTNCLNDQWRAAGANL